MALAPSGFLVTRPEYRPLGLARSASCSAWGLALDPPFSSRLPAFVPLFAALHVGRQTKALILYVRSGVPQRIMGIRLDRGLSANPGVARDA